MYSLLDEEEFYLHFRALKVLLVQAEIVDFR